MSNNNVTKENIEIVEEVSEKERYVSITAKEYDRLIERDQWLCALESAGVDNWCGYEYAYEILEEWEQEC